jgi:hypothetical protein
MGKKSIHGFLLRILIRVQERGSLCPKAFNLRDLTLLLMVRTLKGRKEQRNRLFTHMACDCVLIASWLDPLQTVVMRSYILKN